MHMKNVLEFRERAAKKLSKELKGVNLENKIQYLKDNGVRLMSDPAFDMMSPVLTQKTFEEINQQLINALNIKITMCKRQIVYWNGELNNIDESIPMHKKQTNMRRGLEKDRDDLVTKIDNMTTKYNPVIDLKLTKFYTEQVDEDNNFTGIKDKKIPVNAIKIENVYIITE